jgi:hypothetical protein
MPRRHEPTTGQTNGPGTGSGTGALRGLVGAGPSQVGVVGALRARDVSRPSPEDVAHATAKPEPTARPAARQEEAASGSGGGTSVSS